MAVECRNQMVTTTVRGTQISQCCVHLTECPGPAKCLGADQTDPQKRFRMCRESHDLPGDDPTITIQVGENVYEAMLVGGGL